MTMAAIVTDPLTGIMLSVFRVNARLLEKGDELVAPLQLTSARWQVLGAIALADGPLTAPQIASAMGVTRQGVQKQLNLAMQEGWIQPDENPRHERSPLYALTRAGRRVYDAAMTLEQNWSEALSVGLDAGELAVALRVLKALEERLAATPLPVRGRRA